MVGHSDCEVGNADCNVWHSDCEVGNADCNVGNTDCNDENADSEKSMKTGLKMVNSRALVYGLLCRPAGAKI